MANVVNKLRTMILKLNLAADRDNFIIHLGENDSYALAMFWYQKEYGTVDVEDGDEGLEEYIAKKEYKSLTTFKGIKLNWLFNGETFIEDIKETRYNQETPCIVSRGNSKEANTMNFQNAVAAMKLGSKVRRLSWPEGHYIKARGNFIHSFDDLDNHFMWNVLMEDFEATDFWVLV